MSETRRDHPPETVDHRSPLEAAGIVVRRHPRIEWPGGTMTIDRRLVLGTAEGVDLRLSDPTVSRLHAEIAPRADGVWLRDLGSKNGTFVEDLRIESARVPDGASIRLGASTLVVRSTRVPTPVDLWPEESFGPLIGASVAARELFAQIARVAALEATVLVHGETGTGKELVARAIHDASPRAAGPFIVVDCAALPEGLLEAELFGHTRGAFTGAAAARAGAFESAEGGTVFLDEIGELPLAMQPKLLRVLESRTVRRLGETAARPVDLRVVSATHRDLRTQVNRGAFREDLYFRLAVLPLVVPPLRERLDDVPRLLAHFLGDRSVADLDAAVMREIVSREWPGNLRELRNFAERALAFGARRALAMMGSMTGEGGESLSLPPAAPGILPPPTALSPVETASLTLQDARTRWAAEAEAKEREYLVALLARHGNNVSVAAQNAGLNRTYLHKLIRRHGL